MAIVEKKDVTIRIKFIGKGDARRYGCGNVHFEKDDHQYLGLQKNGEMQTKLLVGAEATMPKEVAEKYLESSEIEVVRK